MADKQGEQGSTIGSGLTHVHINNEIDEQLARKSEARETAERASDELKTEGEQGTRLFEMVGNKLYGPDKDLSTLTPEERTKVTQEMAHIKAEGSMGESSLHPTIKKATQTMEVEIPKNIRESGKAKKAKGDINN